MAVGCVKYAVEQHIGNDWIRSTPFRAVSDEQALNTYNDALKSKAEHASLRLIKINVIEQCSAKR